jgi:hypothetical protein
LRKLSVDRRTILKGNKISGSKVNYSLCLAKYQAINTYEETGTNFTEGWVGPRADLDEVAKGKNPYTSRE